MFHSKGQLIYHSRWVILECPQDILEYYWQWVYKQKGIKLHKPRFGSHISVIRGNEECNRTSILYKKYHENHIEFQYSNILETNGDYWWLPVKSEILEEVREELGLIRLPDFGFHLTIGREKS